jgi:hypothetical protein
MRECQVPKREGIRYLSPSYFCLYLEKGMVDFLRRLWTNQQGATMFEYALLFSLGKRCHSSCRGAAPIEHENSGPYRVLWGHDGRYFAEQFIRHSR